MPPETSYPTVYKYYRNAEREPVARCLELFNRAAGIPAGGTASDLNGPSEREENPGYGCAIGAGPDGLSPEPNDGALYLQSIFDAVMATENNEMQSRLTSEELAELRGYLQTAVELPLDWHFIPIR